LDGAGQQGTYMRVRNIVWLRVVIARTVVLGTFRGGGSECAAIHYPTFSNDVGPLSLGRVRAHLLLHRYYYYHHYFFELCLTIHLIQSINLNM
jgi:hypothetical protein